MNARNWIARAWFISALSLAFSFTGTLQAQYIGVTGFKIVELGNNTYKFVPLCKNGTICSPNETKMHLYMWEFGDGDYSFDSIPQKVYNNAGDYTVTLRVTNIYEDIDRKRESPPNKLVTVTMPAQRVSVKSSKIVKGEGMVPVVKANAIVKAGYPVKYEYEITNLTGAELPIKGTMSRDARQYWKKSGALPYTADFSPNVIANLSFDATDSTLDFVGKIPANGTASIVLSFTAAEQQEDGTILTATLNVEGCNTIYCDTMQAEVGNKVGKSWDPNSIQSVPSRLAISGENLVYVVHFENYGNAAARDIVVVDTLPTILDIQSFKHINSSHPEYLDTVLINGRVITWKFKEIYLPGINPRDVVKRNQGYITFQARVNENAYARTIVENWAWITFDQQEPIRTNYEQNRVLKQDCEPSISMRSLVFLIILLIVVVLALLWVIARYRLRNPVTLQQVLLQQQKTPPADHTQQNIDH